MASTVGAHDLGSFHPERVIDVSGYSTWDIVEIGRPTTTRLELLVGLIQGGITCGTSVYTFFRHVFVIFASKWGLSTLLAKDSELFYNAVLGPVCAAIWLFDLPFERTARHSSSDF